VGGGGLKNSRRLSGRARSATLPGINHADRKCASAQIIRVERPGDYANQIPATPATGPRRIEEGPSVKRAPFSTIAALLAFGLGASPAHANRFWVSGHGTDSGACGPVSAPCLSFQRAHDNAAAGDEIDVLDPADYGTVVITKAISIINDGVGTAGVQVGSGNAVTINAGLRDAVHLRGLDMRRGDKALKRITLGERSCSNRSQLEPSSSRASRMAVAGEFTTVN